MRKTLERGGWPNPSDLESADASVQNAEEQALEVVNTLRQDKGAPAGLGTSGSRMRWLVYVESSRPPDSSRSCLGRSVSSLKERDRVKWEVLLRCWWLLGVRDWGLLFPCSCHVRGGRPGRSRTGRSPAAGGVLEVTGRVPDDLAAGEREPGPCGGTFGCSGPSHGWIPWCGQCRCCAQPSAHARLRGVLWNVCSNMLVLWACALRRCLY
jgi:hypothetical protein